MLEQHRFNNATTGRLFPSSIFYVILANTDQTVIPDPFTEPANLVASLVYRRAGDHTKFDIAIEGPPASTIDEALVRLLHISSRLFNLLDEANKPAASDNMLEIEGGEVNQDVFSLNTIGIG